MIDVGAFDDELQICVLVEDGLTSTRYLKLSYCWGSGNENARTTNANFTDRRTKIDSDELLKTIQDAIQVTRGLGERFLLVDAICIIQPNDATDKETRDWRDQAPKMGQYYRDSICTIAASRSFDSSEGFFGESLSRRYRMQLCELEPWKDSNLPGEGIRTAHIHPSSEPNLPFETIIAKSTLSTRRWVCQEYALSTRVLHWTKNELIFECADLREMEHSSGAGNYPLNPHMKLGTVLELPRADALGPDWFRYINYYSQLNFFQRIG